MTYRQPTIAAILVLLISCNSAAADGPSWPRWRGPEGTGHSDETNLPVHWDAGDVVWSIDLPGRGHSSPIVWGDRIFLTTATDEGRARQVLAIDRRSGDVVWRRVASSGTPEAVHEMNSWATPTCATDGERVIAFFGDGSLHCYDLDGNKLWDRDFGTFETTGWGMASSPVIVGDLVVQTCDADNVAFVAALDKRTGDEVWRTPRYRSRSFSTPVLIDAPGRKELVLNGHDGVHAYNPRTGEELWYCTGGSGRGTPTVVSSHGLVFAISGRCRSENDLMAVRPGGTGDVSATNVAWRAGRSGRDLPSPIVVGDYLFTVNLRPGIATCYEAPTGKVLWKRRMSGNYSASPIAANGLIYVINEAGETTVIELGPEYREVARNRLDPSDDELFRASLMPYQRQIFCRSDRRLYCIGKAGPAAVKSE